MVAQRIMRYSSTTNVFLLFQRWYTDQVQMLCTWLTDRLDRSLHPYQCTCLAHIVKVGHHVNQTTIEKHFTGSFCM